MAASADLCDNLASKAGNKVERAILMAMASQWRRLANHKKKRKSAARDDDAQKGIAPTRLAIGVEIGQHILPRRTKGPQRALEARLAESRYLAVALPKFIVIAISELLCSFDSLDIVGAFQRNRIYETPV
jgi:hypothetical protein